MIRIRRLLPLLGVVVLMVSPVLGQPAEILPEAAVDTPVEVRAEREPAPADPPAEEVEVGPADEVEEDPDEDAAEPPALIPVTREALAEFVDGLVGAFQVEHDLAAVTMAIVKDDDLWLARGYGLADLAAGRPVLPDETLFRIGSVAKTFTWTAVMMLADRGLVDLDADVNIYLKDVQVREAFGKPVTMRHLMHHRAGFEDTFRLFAVSDDDPRSLAELLAAHQPRRVYPPGVRTSYSNWGSALAAQVVEDVTGVPYGEYLQQEILSPLGMHDTTWMPPATMSADMRERLATGYRPREGAVSLQGFMQIGAYWPAGGMAATAADMARWMRFHLNGGELEGVRLLSAEAHGNMWTRGFPDRPRAADLAHGFIDRPHRGLRTLGHAGGTAAFLTNMVLVPELGLGIFLSQNSAREFSPLASIPALVLDRFLDHSYRPNLRDQGNGEDLADLAGAFLNNRRVFTTFAAVLGIAGAARVTPISNRALVVSTQGESDHFVRVPGPGELFENAAGDRIAVMRDDAGKVRAIADPTGVHTFERVGVLRSPNALFAALALAALLAVTSLLGAWKRFGRPTSMSFTSRVAGGIGLLAALAVLLLLAAVANLASGLGDFDLSTMPGNYPNAAMYLVHYAGWLVAAAALAMVVSLWAVWSGSGWGLVRRAHFTLFTVILVFLAIQLWVWRLIGAAVI